MTNSEPVTTHGIIVLHGAGMPDDRSRKRGDTITTVANGFIDFFRAAPLLRSKYELDSTATVKEFSGEKYLDQLDIAIYEKQGSRRGSLKHNLKIREALWKPLTPTIGLLDFMPMLALWSVAFNSHVWRMVQPETWDGQRGPSWDKEGIAKPMGDTYQEPAGIVTKGIRQLGFLQAILIVLRAIAVQSIHSLRDWLRSEETRPGEQDARRRWYDFRGMVLLAVLGAAAAYLWMVGVESLTSTQWFKNLTRPGWFPDWIPHGLASLRPYLPVVVEAIRGLSAAAAVILVFSALWAWVDKERGAPHSRALLNTILTTTTWLAVFLAPIALLIYSFERLARVAQLLFGAGTVVVGALVIAHSLSARQILYLDWLLACLGAFVLSTGVKYGWQFLLGANENFQLKNIAVDWLKALIVMTGAPVIAALFFLLDGLTPLPGIGRTFTWIRDHLPHVALDALKDIQMYLCDSSHAAQVRHVVAEQIDILMTDSSVGSVHVLAHSLGTVVGYDVLAHIGHNTVGQNQPEKIKTLITYGSPLNKMRLLAERTQLDPEIMAGLDYARFLPSAKLRFKNARFCWINFYSPNDAVSDVLTTFSQHDDIIKPHDYSTASATDFFNAHGAYWTDDGFWHTTLQAIGVVYPELRTSGGDLYLRSELQRIEKLTWPFMSELGIPEPIDNQPPSGWLVRRYARRFVSEQLSALRSHGIVTQGQIIARCDLHGLNKLSGAEATASPPHEKPSVGSIHQITMLKVLQLLQVMKRPIEHRWLRGLANLWFALAAAFISVLFLGYFELVLGPSLQGSNILDLQWAFSLEHFTAIVADWQAHGVLPLQIQGLLVDFLFPIAYAPAMASAMAYLARQTNDAAFMILKDSGADARVLEAMQQRLDEVGSHPLRLFLPFIAGALDWVENALHLYLLMNLNSLSPELIFLASTVAVLKWVLIGISLALIVAHLLELFTLQLYRWLHRRRRVAAPASAGRN